jgi:hypothetical protein
MVGNRAIQEGISLAKTKIFFGILILLLAAAGGIFTYYKYVARETPPLSNPIPPKKLINAGEKIIGVGEIETALSQDYFAGGFLVFIPMEKRDGRDYYLSSDEFFLATKLNPPRELREAVSSYNLGVVGEGEGKISSAFLILEIISPDDAASGMRVWEKGMQKELEIFFPKLKIAIASEFRDDFIRNLNARTLGPGDGSLHYLIFNKKFLIIASSRKTMEDIIDRYTAFPPN